MKPYYERDGVTIYHGDCREFDLAAMGADCIVTDPPYGIGYRSNHNSSRKGAWARWVRDDNMPGIKGDDKPPSVTNLLSCCVPSAVFGGNYAPDAPPSRCWIVWNKRRGISPNNQADCELCWTNFDKPSRIFDHLWSGLLRDGSENIAIQPEKYHPHQKPVALLSFVISYSGTSGVVLDPYCGSGSTLVAAKKLGRPAIGIEIEERYCEIAAKRLDATPKNMFAEVS